MAADGEFIAFLKEQLAGFGPVTVRRMFCGAGLYQDSVMFGLVIDGTLYFKTDGENRTRFEESGSAPFAYDAKGRKVVTSYWRAPESCLDDPAEMLRWAHLSLEAARRKQKA